MINEKKLIEDIKNTFSDSVLNQTFGFGKYTLLEAVEEMINRQPQVETDTNVGSKCSDCSRPKFYQQGYQDGLNVDKWIPCEVDMPKEMKEVIISRENSKTGTSVGYYNSVFGWYDQCLLRGVTDVVAWMPKPMEYKKEGAEE